MSNDTIDCEFDDCDELAMDPIPLSGDRDDLWVCSDHRRQINRANPGKTGWIALVVLVFLVIWFALTATGVISL